VNAPATFQPLADIVGHAIEEFVALWYSRCGGRNTRGIEAVDDARVRLNKVTPRRQLR
jgi:hypothetical protein